MLFSGHVAGSDRDALLLTGPEPNMRWRALTRIVVELAREAEVGMVVSLGALLADVPHTRPVQITGIAGDPALAERLGSSQTRYEGPTGIVGVLQDGCRRAGLGCASLWAAVPHYVAAVPSPKAALGLVRTMERLLEIEVEADELETASSEYEERLDEAVANEPEVRSLVERLEQQLDEEDISFGDLPSGDSIAREFQRFLRDQGRRGEG